MEVVSIHNHHNVKANCTQQQDYLMQVQISITSLQWSKTMDWFTAISMFRVIIVHIISQHAAVLLVMFCICCYEKLVGIYSHSATRALVISDAGVRWGGLVFRWVRLRSGLYAGHSSSSTPTFTDHVSELTLCMGTGLGLLVPVEGNLNAKDNVSEHFWASIFVVTDWGRTRYGCDGQVSIDFWPYCNLH